METDPSDGALQTLHDLGLTALQAKAYLALVRAKALTIADIAANAKIHRPDLYRVIQELEQKGLVERIIANPVQFKPIPLAECVLLLLKQRTEEINECRSRALKLLQESRDDSDSGFHEDRSRFLLVPGSRVVDRIAKSIDAANETIDYLLSWSRFSQGAFGYSEHLQRALSRGLRIRVIVEKPADADMSSEHFSFCRHENCRERFVNCLPRTVLSVYDGREVFIVENPKAELSGSPVLWSNNASLIALAQDYFEALWHSAAETNLG
jgi:sugar-specific transcriptional regulator TrmB